MSPCGIRLLGICALDRHVQVSLNSLLPSGKVRSISDGTPWTTLDYCLDARGTRLDGSLVLAQAYS